MFVFRAFLYTLRGMCIDQRIDRRCWAACCSSASNHAGAFEQSQAIHGGESHPLHSGRLNARCGVVAGFECINLGRAISGALMIAATSLSLSPRNIAARANCTTCRSSLAILTACFALLVIHCLLVRCGVGGGS